MTPDFRASSAAIVTAYLRQVGPSLAASPNVIGTDPAGDRAVVRRGAVPADVPG